MTKKSKIIAFVAVVLTASAFGFTNMTFAETTTTPTSWKSSQRHIKNYLEHAKGTIGTVTSVNGSTIAITTKDNTAYSVDASTAKILKNRNTIVPVSGVLVGDTVMVQGTVTGTNIAATTIFDGKLPIKKISKGKHKGLDTQVKS